MTLSEEERKLIFVGDKRCKRRVGVVLTVVVLCVVGFAGGVPSLGSFC